MNAVKKYLVFQLLILFSWSLSGQRLIEEVNYPEIEGVVIDLMKDEQNGKQIRITKQYIGKSKTKKNAIGDPLDEYQLFVHMDDGEKFSLKGQKVIAYYNGKIVTSESDWNGKVTDIYVFSISEGKVLLENTKEFPMAFMPCTGTKSGNLLFNNSYEGYGTEVAIYNYQIEVLIKYIPFKNGFSHLSIGGDEKGTVIVSGAFSDNDSLCITEFDKTGQLKSENKYGIELNGFYPDEIFINDDYLFLYGPYQYESMELVTIERATGKVLWKSTTSVGYNRYDKNVPVIANNTVITTSFQKGNPPKESLQCIELSNGSKKWIVDGQRFASDEHIQHDGKISGLRIINPIIHSEKIVFLTGYMLVNKEGRYVGHQITYLVMLNIDNGEIIEKKEMNDLFTFPSLETANDTLIINCSQKRVKYTF